MPKFKRKLTFLAVYIEPDVVNATGYFSCIYSAVNNKRCNFLASRTSKIEKKSSILNERCPKKNQPQSTKTLVSLVFTACLAVKNGVLRDVVELVYLRLWLLSAGLIYCSTMSSKNRLF